jgi:hypothetical protein
MNTTTTDTDLESPEDERDPVQEMRDRVRAAGYPPERIKAETAAFHEIKKQYPRMYAVIRSKWDGEKLVEPYLLAVGDTEQEGLSLYDALPDEQREGAEVRYVHPVDQAFAYVPQG